MNIECIFVSDTFSPDFHINYLFDLCVEWIKIRSLIYFVDYLFKKLILLTEV